MAKKICSKWIWKIVSSSVKTCFPKKDKALPLEMPKNSFSTTQNIGIIWRKWIGKSSNCLGGWHRTSTWHPCWKETISESWSFAYDWKKCWKNLTWLCRNPQLACIFVPERQPKGQELSAAKAFFLAQLMAGGPAFLRPEDELTVRLCYVCFDGSQGLQESLRLGLSASLPDDFVQQYCPNVYKGIKVRKRQMDEDPLEVMQTNSAICEHMNRYMFWDKSWADFSNNLPAKEFTPRKANLWALICISEPSQICEYSIKKEKYLVTDHSSCAGKFSSCRCKLSTDICNLLCFRQYGHGWGNNKPSTSEMSGILPMADESREGTNVLSIVETTHNCYQKLWQILIYNCWHK